MTVVGAVSGLVGVVLAASGIVGVVLAASGIVGVVFEAEAAALDVKVDGLIVAVGVALMKDFLSGGLGFTESGFSGTGAVDGGLGATAGFDIDFCFSPSVSLTLSLILSVLFSPLRAERFY